MYECLVLVTGPGWAIACVPKGRAKMPDTQNVFDSATNWYAADAGDIDAFIAEIPSETRASDWPHANEIIQNVLI